MKRYWILILAAAICVFSLSASASTMIVDGEEVDHYEIDFNPTNQDWLLSQIDAASPEDYADLITALYIVNTIQFGPYDDSEDLRDVRPAADRICNWLDLMEFDYTSEQINELLRLHISEDVYIDVFSEDNIVTKLELVLTSIQNAYDKDLRIAIAF